MFVGTRRTAQEVMSVYTDQSGLLVADIVEIHAELGIAAADVENRILWLDVFVQMATKLRVLAIPAGI